MGVELVDLEQGKGGQGQGAAGAAAAEAKDKDTADTKRPEPVQDKIVVGLRPNMARIMSDAADEALSMGLTRVGAMTCGPSSLVMDVREQAFRQSQLWRVPGENTYDRVQRLIAQAEADADTELSRERLEQILQTEMRTQPPGGVKVEVVFHAEDFSL